MSADTVTVLRSVDNAVLTKRIRPRAAGGFDIQPYDRCTWVAVERVPVDGIVNLGRLIARLQSDRHCCIIRGAPKPGINLKRCRRLFHDHIEDDGSVTPATFDAARSQAIGIDVDSLECPAWCPEVLAARRSAIERDRAEHGMPQPKGEDDGESVDLNGDDDPAPVDPAIDHEIACRAAINELPEEFHDATCYWQLTSGAGIKEGIRLRLWYWFDRAVSDAEAKRWLGGSPVDTSLYSAVQAHYVARPIFRPASLNPVPARSGFFWRHVNVVAVPELPEPPPPPSASAARRQTTPRAAGPPPTPKAASAPPEMRLLATATRLCAAPPLPCSAWSSTACWTNRTPGTACATRPPPSHGRKTAPRSCWSGAEPSPRHTTPCPKDGDDHGSRHGRSPGEGPSVQAAAASRGTARSARQGHPRTGNATA